MTPLSRFILLSGVLVSLAGCATEEGVTTATRTKTIVLNQPYPVNVASLVVENRYDPLSSAKDISSTMAIPLDASLKNYAERRFKTVGQDGTLHFVIRDAALFQEHKDSPIKAGQALGVGRQDRYTAVVKIGLIREATAASIGAMGTELRAERSLTIPANVSLNERDARLQELTTDILNDIDQSARDGLGNAMKLGAPDPDMIEQMPSVR